MYKEARNIADEFSRITREVPGSIKFYLDEKNICDKAISDIRHFAEFNKTDRTTDRKLIRTLREYSKRRREADDNIKILKPLAEFIDNNSVALNRLDQLRGEMKKMAQYVESDRVYKPRILEELFEGR
ncbi:MAG: hypothetical protein H6Q73_3807 [Firmicutes bacterium]|nr:hypothetical protein [Bacillota bacterium]